MAREFLRQLEHRQLLAVLTNRDFLARTHFVRRNIDLAIVDGDVSVTHQLPRLAPRLRESKPEHDVIETPFQLLQQLLTGHALGTGGFLEVIAELSFLREVDAFRFLLFTQLQTVAYDLGLAVFPMLSGSKITLLDRTFIAEALRAFEEQLHALAAA